ncbi:hypothetical protein ACFX13_026831 [Malus domestica]
MKELKTNRVALQRQRGQKKQLKLSLFKTKQPHKSFLKK